MTTGVGRAIGLALVLVFSAALPGAEPPQPAPVQAARVANGGIEPQAVVDDKGVLHLLYFKGDPAGGDLFYVTFFKTWSQPIRVNSVPASAIAVGSIRGGQIALGRDGRAHVAWNGSAKTPPGMYYARLSDDHTAFEPQRNLMQKSAGLDGGGTIAADNAGRVYVAWHGQEAVAGNPPRGEENRKVWLARSEDDGKTFTPEVVASPDPTGACGCCAMKALATPAGGVFLMYRSATQTTHRDIYLLASRDHGKSFTSTRVHPWELNACPMSSESMAPAGDGVLMAWETDGQIFYARVAGAGAKPELVTVNAVPGRAGGRKHPSIAVNARGEFIIAWAEGTGWNKGGRYAWQVFDDQGKPLADAAGRGDGVPPWSFPAAYTQDSFHVVY